MGKCLYVDKTTKDSLVLATLKMYLLLNSVPAWSRESQKYPVVGTLHFFFLVSSIKLKLTLNPFTTKHIETLLGFVSWSGSVLITKLVTGVFSDRYCLYSLVCLECGKKRKLVTLPTISCVLFVRADWSVASVTKQVSGSGEERKESTLTESEPAA